MLLAAIIYHGWRPGPGEYGPLGWILCGGYLAAALLAWRAARADAARGLDPFLWQALAAACVVLALNQRLSLHGLVTHLGRELASSEGWYKVRRPVQVALLVGLVFTAWTTLGWVFRRAGPQWRRQRWPWISLILLVTFLGVRTASFHYLDQFLSTWRSGFRLQTMIELDGLCLLVVSLLWNTDQPNPPAPG